jgi:hypothetical protein
MRYDTGDYPQSVRLCAEPLNLQHRLGFGTFASRSMALCVMSCLHRQDAPPSTRHFAYVALRAAFRMARAAEGTATSRARSQRCRNNQVKRVIAHQARPVGRGGELACRRLQRPRQRVPVQLDYPIRLAPTYLHRETMDLHREVKCLSPLDLHARGVLTRQISRRRLGSSSGSAAARRIASRCRSL